MKLRGPVRSIYETSDTLVFQSGQWVVGKRKASYFGESFYKTFFDTKGAVREKLIYSEGEFKSRETYAYRDEDRTVIITYLNCRGTVTNHQLVAYNRQWQQIEERIYKTSPLNYGFRMTYEYDRRGREIKSIQWQEWRTKKPLYWWLTSYDEAQNRAEEVTYRKNGTVYSRTVYTTDTIRPSGIMGMRVRNVRTTYDTNNSAQYHLAEFRDSLGRLRTILSISEDYKDRLISRREYDENGNCYYHLRKLANQEWQQTHYRYNEYGDQIAVYNAWYASYPDSSYATPTRTDTIISERKYDQHGNWIQIIVKKRAADAGSSQDQPLWVWHREITYFKE
jgi:hypothetical protein